MSSKKPPCVDVRTDVHKDVRFEVLGEVAGYNRYEAIGRMHALWSWCVDRGLQDAPDDSDGYVVSDAVVRRFLGAEGVRAILGDGCDDFALGARRDDGRIYLRGTSSQVAAARARAATASAGGEARANGARDEGGRFVGGATNVQPEPQPQASSPPPVRPAADQPNPAPSPSSSSSPSDQNDHTPRAIQPAHGQAQKLATAIWTLGDQQHSKLKGEGIERNAIGWGQPFGDAWDRCRSRVVELLEVMSFEDARALLERVLEVRAAEARDKRHLKFFIPSRIFDAASFAMARSLTPQQVIADRSPSRAGAKSSRGALGSATPRKDFGEESRPAREVFND